ncbi:MAG TPA: hypothetical protein VIY47_17285, partial [Ignavibacteriaceae bacterium]
MGDFCYRDETPKKFRKGTDEKRGVVYIIDRIVTNRSVKRYFLVNLNFKPQLGAVYSENIRKVPEAALPTSPESFVVEKIVKYVIRNGIEYALIKFVGRDEEMEVAKS